MEEEVEEEGPMTTISRHYFGDEPFCSISIIENIKEDYGQFVWPCSVVLAEYVWQQRFRFSGASVVEVLGAGTSLPGLVAAKVGANVTLTDHANGLEVLDNMRRVCHLNELNYIGIDMGGLGCIYIQLVSNNYSCGHHLIEFLMVKWGLKCVKLLDSFSFMPSQKASGLSGNLQLAEIVLNTKVSELKV
ncbi:hypothetical protein CsatA_013924 [Cannabis sativa]